MEIHYSEVIAKLMRSGKCHYLLVDDTLDSIFSDTLPAIFDIYFSEE